MAKMVGLYADKGVNFKYAADSYGAMIQAFGGSALGVNQDITQFMASTGKNLNMSQKGISSLYYSMSLFGDGAQKSTKQVAL